MSSDAKGGDVLSRFRPLFEPKSIAIVGASSGNRTRANDVLEFTRAMGFAGPIYPIHPGAAEIDGLRAYRSFSDCPTEIDYAFVAIGAARVPELLASARGRVRYAQIMASGFGETVEGEALNRRMLETARANGVRLIGPNCLGTYSPRGRLSYIRDCPAEPGSVGLISQSGGISTDMLRRGVQRGLRYSGVVSVGNCADLTPTELLEYFQADPSTRVIGLYLESLRDGRAFFEMLRRGDSSKPVVILKGARTGQGQRAALSHTGALAGDDRLWLALSRQTGVTLASTIDEFIDALITFQCVEPSFDRATAGAFLVGNGGGASVLAADTMARLGMPVREASPAIRDALAGLGLPAGTSIENPMDVPSGALRKDDGHIAAAVLSRLIDVERPDAILFHVNMPQFLTNPSIPDFVFENLVQAAIDVRGRNRGGPPIFLALRSDGSAAVDERKRPARDRALAARIPVFDEIPNALVALSHLQRFERFHRRRMQRRESTNKTDLQRT